MDRLAFLGVDVGWVFPAADSDGNIYEWTRRRQPRIPLVPAGPVTIRKADGTTFIQPAYSPGEAATAFARATTANIRGVAQRIVTAARDSERAVALEDWSTFERRKKAWTRVYGEIADRAAGRGVPVVQVNRAYTSITCPECDHKGRENRATRDVFRCVRCGFAGHADVIAAMNIARRAAGTFQADQGRCENAAHEAPAWKAGLCIVCYRFRWKAGRLPTVDDFRLKAESPDMNQYRQEMRQRSLEERIERRDRETRERLLESWRTHDAHGNPLTDTAATALDE